MPTNLLYLENFTQTEGEAKVVDAISEDGCDIVVLNQTIFYPQGGGQPYDQGVIEGKSGKFLMEEVRFVEGIVKHIGKFEKGEFKKGDEVKCLVDRERRELNSRLHSAGHLVDMAVTELKLGWTPGKGFHFPNGPYVEYAGELGEIDREKLKADLEAACNKFIGQDIPVKAVFMDKDKMLKVCHFVPDYLPEGKPGRVVMFGDFGVPCGGTHVSSLGEIKSETIRKIKSEGSNNIRVAYDIARS